MRKSEENNRVKNKREKIVTKHLFGSPDTFAYCDIVSFSSGLQIYFKLLFSLLMI